MPRRKALKTGSRTRGRGHKKGRGAGLRGGRGNAGCHKTKRIMYERVGRVWGAHGFHFGTIFTPLGTTLAPFLGSWGCPGTTSDIILALL